MNDETNPGLAIEGFAVAAKNRVFGSSIDRHHPEVTWAAADVARSEDNFPETKQHVQRALSSLQHTLYHEKTNDDLLNELSGLTDQVESAASPTELSEVIVEWRPILNRAYQK